MRDRHIAEAQLTELQEYIRRCGHKTDKEFAFSLGWKPETLSGINRKAYLPTVQMMRELCEALGVLPLDLYAPDELDLKNACKPVRATERKRGIRGRRISVELNSENYNRAERAIRRYGLGMSVHELTRTALREYLDKLEATEPPEVELMEVRA